MCYFAELLFVQLPVIRECSYKLMFQTPKPDQWIKEYSRHVSYTTMDVEGSATPVGNLSLDAMQCKWPAILGGDLDTLYFVLIVNENNKGSD